MYTALITWLTLTIPACSQCLAPRRLALELPAPANQKEAGYHGCSFWRLLRKEMTKPPGQEEGAANAQLSKNRCTIPSIQLSVDRMPPVPGDVRMTRCGLCSRGPGMPVRNWNQRCECTTEENSGPGSGKHFMGPQRWRQREGGGRHWRDQAQSFRVMPPYLISLAGWPEGPLRFPHFSPVLAQVLTSSLGPGSLCSTPKATAYNVSPILPCLKAAYGKRGST